MIIALGYTLIAFGFIYPLIATAFEKVRHPEKTLKEIWRDL